MDAPKQPADLNAVAPPNEKNNVPRKPRIRAINADSPNTSKGLLPLAACDCDSHCNTYVPVCVGDVPIDVDACGVYG